mmetsp:Transcript_9171/g.13824  ORF Transcript_9171/g.13824 Transcript_9171/m.13824 type:complete len:269 (+) Transcript_9171:67-873(+)
MGDNLEDDVFEFENEINEYDNKSDSQSDSESDAEEEVSNEELQALAKKQEKKAKRKQKFEEMKAKKKAKGNCVKEKLTLVSPAEQCRLFLSTGAAGGSNPGSFTPEHFFSPSSVPSLKNPFMVAVASGIESYRSVLNSEAVEPGCPFVVIVCSGARRAASVINAISKEAKCKIGKLFAKHFKVQDQVVALRAHFPIVVGTPNRLAKLVELGALSLSATQVLLVDMEKDAKGFSVLDLPGVCGDFYSFMSGPVSAESDHIRISLVTETS